VKEEDLREVMLAVMPGRPAPYLPLYPDPGDIEIPEAGEALTKEQAAAQQWRAYREDLREWAVHRCNAVDALLAERWRRAEAKPAGPPVVYTDDPLYRDLQEAAPAETARGHG
jgi:hypothetical protein